ncbi:type II and III secretion system protein family protein [Maricurvus nonylphenolicus]|uniref:type II and III secretion system protein family protein n=1 Tax=Maricurvus nonylphenolicus TaxID=1008307 RepID=UPI0036F3D596
MNGSHNLANSRVITQTRMDAEGFRLMGLCLLLVCSLLSPPSFSQSPEPYQLAFGSKTQEDELQLSIGRSQIINSNKALEQVVIGEPEVADIKLLNSRQVLILGKAPGRTNLALRGKGSGEVVLLNVVVNYDLTGLKRKINDVLPQETTLEVRGSNDSVILSGSVTSTISLETVMEITKSFVPEDKIVNSMSVGGGHQVMLEVKVAEIKRNNLRELGIGLDLVSKNGNWTLDTTSGAVVDNAFGILDIAKGSNKYLSSTDLTLQALEQKGLAKLLAEPNLVALSGQEASFLVGGEVPIPIDEGSDGISIEFKEFGVGLQFRPTVLSEAKINLKFQSEVSAIDESQAFNIGGGLNIPSFITRRAESTIEMGDGQSFAVAGLLQSNANNLISQYPGLGDIPILGALFRSTDYQREETELVLVITARLVKPVEAGSLANLTDTFVPPNALDQYLLGRLQGTSLWRATPKSKNTSTASDDQSARIGIDGMFGHQVAEAY